MPYANTIDAADHPLYLGDRKNPAQLKKMPRTGGAFSASLNRFIIR
jgi:hypothetical protein